MGPANESTYYSAFRFQTVGRQLGRCTIVLALSTCQLLPYALGQQTFNLFNVLAVVLPQQPESTDQLPSPNEPPAQPVKPSILESATGVDVQANTDALASDQQRAYLGLEAEELKGGGVGVRVSDVTRDSPAWKAGFQVDDRIIAVNGFAIAGMSGMVQQLGKARPGQTIMFLVTRSGRNLEMSATLINADMARQLTDTPVDNLGSAWMGATVHDLTQSFREQFGIAAYRGAAVTQVVAGSPAHLAGIRAGDAITEAAGQPIETKLEYESWLEQTKPGDRVPLVIYRGITRIPTQVVLTGQPQPQPAPAWRRPSSARRSIDVTPTTDFERQPEESSGTGQPTIAEPLPIPENSAVAESATDQQASQAERVQELEAQVQQLRAELAEAQAKLAETKKQLDSILRAIKD